MNKSTIPKGASSCASHSKWVGNHCQLDTILRKTLTIPPWQNSWTSGTTDILCAWKVWWSWSNASLVQDQSNDESAPPNTWHR